MTYSSAADRDLVSACDRRHRGRLDRGDEDVRPYRDPPDHRLGRTTRRQRHLLALPHPSGWHLSRQPARPAGGFRGDQALTAVAAGVQTAANAGAGESGRTGRGPDHRLFPARVRALAWRFSAGLQVPSRTSPHLLAAHAPPPEALTAGFQRALLVSALCLVAAAAIAFRASNTRGEPAATPEIQEDLEPSYDPAWTTYENEIRDAGQHHPWDLLRRRVRSAPIPRPPNSPPRRRRYL